MREHGLGAQEFVDGVFFVLWMLPVALITLIGTLLIFLILAITALIGAPLSRVRINLERKLGGHDDFC